MQHNKPIFLYNTPRRLFGGQGPEVPSLLSTSVLSVEITKKKTKKIESN
jgi:hypothetical protein